MITIDFNKWVNDNNPSENLSYRKGWWDYIEFIRALSYKYEIPSISVVSTYNMGTPPPQEILLMPVILMKSDKASIFVKLDFGRFDKQWTLSFEMESPSNHNMHSLFDVNKDLSGTIIPGFSGDYTFGSYFKSNQCGFKFTCEVDDEWDVDSLFRILFR